MASNKNNQFKILLTELLQFFASMPASPEKKQLDNIISLMMMGKINLKSTLNIIQGNIDKEKSNKNTDTTLRQKNIKIWEYVLSIFTRHLRRN
jgi:hypothetical protein